MLFGERIRVSQALSLVMVLVSLAVLYYNLKVRKASPDTLYVNQKTMEAPTSDTPKEESHEVSN